VGKVPVLVDGELAVWDSLAIVEYVADTFPDKPVWPADRTARARARSICAEMHAGFQALRSHLVLNFQVTFPRAFWPVAVQKDIARIFEMWADCRRGFGAGGPFLFGRFSAADAYFAPVVRRFRTYDVKAPDVPAAYMQAVDELPGLRAWAEAARRENDFVPEDEPYRQGPADRP
jgi:glutathione S-transferase